MNLKILFINYIKLRERLKNAKIYKITDNTNNNIYIGSTCKTLKERLLGHKRDYKKLLRGIGSNISSFDIIKNNDYNIELIENCDIKTTQELLKREGFYIQNNKCLNRLTPGRTKKEYYNLNKDKIDNYQKIYKDTNKEVLKIKKHLFYIENKDRINIKKKEKFVCPCGGKFNYSDKAKHLKTLKHKKYIETLK